MKNILIITPFYPYPDDKQLIQDTNAVYYLTKNKKEDERITIIYYYQHTRQNAWLNLPRILSKKAYKDCLYKDDRGNDVLLFEHPCLIPHSFNTIPYFDKKYGKFINDYLKDNSILVDSLIVHFPVRFTPFATKIESKHKVAICHSFDVEKGRLEVTKSYDRYYDTIGFRSPQIRKLYNGGCNNDGYLCLSGVPDEYLTKQKNSYKWKLDGVLRLCFAGKLVKNKNLSNVIKALNAIKDRVKFELSIIGEGEEYEALVNLSSAFNLDNNIHFFGKLNRDEVFEMFMNNDVFIMTSFKETLGLVYLEAMAAGNLIIASKDRGIDGLVKQNHGALFVDPNSIDSIASAIEQYYNMPQEQVNLLKDEIQDIMIHYSESEASRAYLDVANERRF